jgi:hypothetical protein
VVDFAEASSGEAPVDKKLTQAEWIIVVGGVVAFIASFLPWIDYHGFTASAWSDTAFPTYTWVGIFGFLMAAVIVVRAFTTVKLPADVLGFTWTQIHLVLGIFAAIIAASFMIAGDNFGIGFWLSLLAAAALVVGAVMLHNEAPAPSAY